MTDIHHKALLIFIKNPKRGFVKTRLAERIGQQDATDLYSHFVHDTIQLAYALRIPFYICYTPFSDLSDLVDWLGPELNYIPQIGDSLGDRLINAFQKMLSAGCQNVVAIGSDSPDLPQSYVIDAFKSLNSYDIVIGPTNDQGYYCVGVRQDTFNPIIFTGINWSTDRVYQETVSRIQFLKHSIFELPKWYDVDTYVDLQALIHRNRSSPFRHSHTMGFIRRTLPFLLSPNIHIKTPKEYGS